MNFAEIKKIAWLTLGEILGITISAPFTGTPSSSTFLRGDGSWATNGSGTVTDVTASGVLSSSGGTTPNITLTGIVPTANGGTGVAFFSVSGPTVARVYAFPDQAATILYSGGALGTPSSGTLTNCTFPTLNQNTTGSAGSLKSTATTGLMTITGPGAASIREKTVRDANDTLLELGGSYTPTGTWTSLTLVAPVLGTPASGVATNLTGTASGLTAGNVTTNANLTGDVTSVGNATTLTNAPVIAKVLTGYTSGAGTVAATDSILQAIQKLNGNDATNANLTGPITSIGNATAIASQTGTGTKIVVDNGPTLIAPLLGTPASGVLTNCTGTASGLTAGTATTAVGANALYSATTTVSVSAATAPTSGQVLTATGGTAATWQTPATTPNPINDAFFFAMMARRGTTKSERGLVLG